MSSNPLPPIGAYVGDGSTWSAMASTDPAGVGPAFTPPAAGLYAYNSGLGQWVPWSGSGGGGGGAPTGPAGGDLSGNYPNPTVKGSSGAAVFSAAGAANTPGLMVSGAPFNGGTTTTNTPQLYLNSGATAPTTWSAAGTVLGGNAPSGFAGNFVDFHSNGGTSLFSISSTGAVSCNTVSVPGTASFNVSTATSVANFGLKVSNTGLVSWSSTISTAGANDVNLSRQAAGILQLASGAAAGNTGSLSLGQVLVNGGAAAASTSQLYCNTVPYTAGTTSTNQPVAYLDSAGATQPTTWSAGGTVLGMNSPSGFGGLFLDCHINGGASVFSVSANGTVATTGPVTATGGFKCSTTYVQGSGGTLYASSNYIAWSSVGVAGTIDASLSRAGTGTLQIGSGVANGSTGSLKLGQILGGSGAPAIAAGTGAGTSPTVSVSGNNTSGQINLTTGTSPAASAAIATVTFAGTSPYPAAPYVVFSPANAAAAALTGGQGIYVTATAANFALNAGSAALAAATQYLWNYVIMG